MAGVPPTPLPGGLAHGAPALAEASERPTIFGIPLPGGETRDPPPPVADTPLPPRHPVPNAARQARGDDAPQQPAGTRGPRPPTDRSLLETLFGTPL